MLLIQSALVKERNKSCVLKISDKNIKRLKEREKEILKAGKGHPAKPVAEQHLEVESMA